MAEVVGAFASNSLSLLGDAGAMSIDVFTVKSCKTLSFCNLITADRNLLETPVTHLQIFLISYTTHTVHLQYLR